MMRNYFNQLDTRKSVELANILDDLIPESTVDHLWYLAENSSQSCLLLASELSMEIGGSSERNLLLNVGGPSLGFHCMFHPTPSTNATCSSPTDPIQSSYLGCSGPGVHSRVSCTLFLCDPFPIYVLIN